MKSRLRRSLLAILAVTLTSIWCIPMSNAEKNTDQLAEAAGKFRRSVSAIDNTRALDHAEDLRKLTIELKDQGERDFGSESYRSTYGQVRNVVKVIGGMNIEASSGIRDSWRDVHSNLKAIDQKLGSVAGKTSDRAGDKKTRNRGDQDRKDDDSPDDRKVQVSAAKNGPNSGMHVDQVEDLSEQAKNAYRDLLDRQPKLRDRKWAKRLDGFLSAFDQKANNLRDEFKKGGEWVPVLNAMKRRASHIDRILVKREVGGGVRGHWTKLINHLEKI